jgi:hypothetical protein
MIVTRCRHPPLRGRVYICHLAEQLHRVQLVYVSSRLNGAPRSWLDS